MENCTKLHHVFDTREEHFDEVMIWDSENKIYLVPSQVQEIDEPKHNRPSLKPKEITLEVGKKSIEGIFYFLLLLLGFLYSALCVLVELLKILHNTSKYNSKPTKYEHQPTDKRKTVEKKNITVNVNINA